MSERKLEILKKLRKYVEEDKYIQYFYKGEMEEDKGCYCSVGFIMNECGFDMRKVVESHWNTTYIDNISSEFGDDGEKVFSIFSVKELDELQTINDILEKRHLLEHIDKMISEVE